MLVELIEQNTSALAYTIKDKYKHGDTITVGGKVKFIFNGKHISDTYDDYQVVIVDDCTGFITLLFPQNIYASLSTEKHFNISDVIIATGKYYNIDNGKDIYVLCWDVNLLQKGSE